MDNRRLPAISKTRNLVKTGVARSIRVAAGVSQADIAREVGVSAAAVCRWEAAQRLPRGDAAVRYGQVLEQLIKRGNE